MPATGAAPAGAGPLMDEGNGGVRPLFTRLLAGVLLLAAPVAPAETGPARPELVVDQYSSRYDHLFRHYASRFFGPFVDWRWFKAQAVAESLLDHRAESPAGALGVMQLLPSTYGELKQGFPDWGDIRSPRWNIAAGMFYNRMLYRKWSSAFHGQDRFLLMLASYNAGYYRVHSAYRRAVPVRSWDDLKERVPGETRAYVARIVELMQPLPQPERALVADSGGEGVQQQAFSRGPERAVEAR